MPKYAPWIIVAAVFGLAVFIYLENRSLMRRLEQITQANLPQPPATVAPSPPGSGSSPVVPPAPTPTGPSQASLTPSRSSRLLRGTCLDPAKIPLPGVDVVAVIRDPIGDKKEYRRVVSDASGQFAIQWQSPEQIEALRAERDGFAPAELSQADLETTRFVELILEPLASCEVQVFRNRPDGALDRYSGPATIYVLRRVPAEGEPQPTREVSQLPGRFVTIGAEQAEVKNGRHVLQGYPPGIYKIAIVNGEEYAESEPFSLNKIGQVVATVVLGTRQRFAGTVLSKLDQRPVAGAQVSLTPQKLPHPELEKSLTLRASTDSDGHFVFEKVVPSVYVLTIAADGYTTQVVDELTIPGGSEPPQPQTFYLQPGAPSLRVEVVGPDNQPVPGAKIAVYALNAPTVTPSHFADTDAQGVATVSSIVPGRYTVIVSMPDAPERQKYQEVLVPEEGSAVVKVNFRPLVEVQGTAKLSTGEAWNGLIYFIPRGQLGPKTFTRTNLDGSFRVELEPGEYVVGRADQPPTTLLRVYAQGNTDLVVTLK